MEPVFDPIEQKGLWTHMFKKATIRVCSRGEYESRADILSELQTEVAQSMFQPNLHGFLSAEKSNGVARFTPVMDLRLCSVYFACVRAIDEVCAEEAVPGTFGGWTLGGARRGKEQAHFEKELSVDLRTGNYRLPLESNQPKRRNSAEGSTAERPPDRSTENEEELIDISGSMPSSPYNKVAWVKNWQNYWKVLANLSEDPGGEWFVSIDLANFYDSIDIDLLITKLGNLGVKSPVSDVLKFILCRWHRGKRHYLDSRRGLPMDVIGDMSRVLANFYLVEFDRTFSERVGDMGGKYIRWADDMTFTARNKEQAIALVYFASEILHTHGLNINASKVDFRQKGEFELGWGFEILDKLESHAENVDVIFDEIVTWCRREDFRRKDTLIKRLLTLSGDSSGSQRCRKLICDYAWSHPEFIYKMSESQVKKFVLVSPENGLSAAAMASMISERPFTAPKVEFLRAMEKLAKTEGGEYLTIYNSFAEVLRGEENPCIRLALMHAERLA